MVIIRRRWALHNVSKRQRAGAQMRFVEHNNGVSNAVAASTVRRSHPASPGCTTSCQYGSWWRRAPARRVLGSRGASCTSCPTLHTRARVFHLQQHCHGRRRSAATRSQQRPPTGRRRRRGSRDRGVSFLASASLRRQPRAHHSAVMTRMSSSVRSAPPAPPPPRRSKSTPASM